MRAPIELTGVQPVSASENTDSSMKGVTSRELTHAEIESIIISFGDAAVRCEEAGFSGIELHGAHSYLISQFLGMKTNRRNDQWGGDLLGRSMLLKHIIQNVRARTSENFVVGVRPSDCSMVCRVGSGFYSRFLLGCVPNKNRPKRTRNVTNKMVQPTSKRPDTNHHHR
jgi:2,4-dienoyl-CoA reductase-like NADH-dependent reductase (Old Yellow Enzyme family)